VWTIPDHDPPDLWLDVDGITYAVEVTSTPARFGEPWPDAPTQETYLFACQRLLGKVKEIALGRDSLRGWYGVSFYPRGAVGKKDFPRWRVHIKSALLDYILQTRDLHEAPGHMIHWDQRQVCSIRRYSNERRHVGFLAVGFSYEGEVRENARRLL